MWNYLVIFLIALLIVLTTRDCATTTEVKRRYNILLDHLNTENCPDEFKVLRKRIVITMVRKRYGEVGYNVDKGAEIGLCIDGDPNHAFHVLIHELAHSTIKEYSHSTDFWNNCEKLKNICVDLGIYETIPTKTPFCNKTVQD
jgi:hypothetical protein